MRCGFSHCRGFPRWRPSRKPTGGATPPGKESGKALALKKNEYGVDFIPLILLKRRSQFVKEIKLWGIKSMICFIAEFWFSKEICCVFCWLLISFFEREADSQISPKFDDFDGSH